MHVFDTVQKQIFRQNNMIFCEIYLSQKEFNASQFNWSVMLERDALNKKKFILNHDQNEAARKRCFYTSFIVRKNSFMEAGLLLYILF